MSEDPAHHVRRILGHHQSQVASSPPGRQTILGFRGYRRALACRLAVDVKGLTEFAVEAHAAVGVPRARVLDADHVRVTFRSRTLPHLALAVTCDLPLPVGPRRRRPRRRVERVTGPSRWLWCGTFTPGSAALATSAQHPPAGDRTARGRATPEGEEADDGAGGEGEAGLDGEVGEDRFDDRAVLLDGGGVLVAGVAHGPQRGGQVGHRAPQVAQRLCGERDLGESWLSSWETAELQYVVSASTSCAADRQADAASRSRSVSALGQA